ncbi:acyl carrier protein [Streptomyces zagrosensis]|uniref:Acyl carrier protein n=1 Tax=Streptomyces zagrosensis TaxID=1042984 RepID=A0A7W9QI77_9ACTN|nr:phosphopantetheine-binding protein [Streptomyces zagrosensis]MBB5940183.1 acyl carrier protein [Streptomyces zagrosensis]
MTTREDLTNEVIALTERTAPDLEATVTADLSFDEMGMDSLTRMDLLAAVERAYGLEVPDDQIGDLIRISDVVDFLTASKAGV